MRVMHRCQSIIKSVSSSIKFVDTVCVGLLDFEMQIIHDIFFVMVIFISVKVTEYIQGYWIHTKIEYIIIAHENKLKVFPSWYHDIVIMKIYYSGITQHRYKTYIGIL